MQSPGLSGYRGRASNSPIGIKDGETRFSGEFHPYWKWQIFLREPYKHIYFRDNHYFTGPENTEKVRVSAFNEAFDDMVNVLLQYHEQD